MQKRPNGPKQPSRSFPGFTGSRVVWTYYKEQLFFVERKIPTNPHLLNKHVSLFAQLLKHCIDFALNVCCTSGSICYCAERKDQKLAEKVESRVWSRLLVLGGVVRLLLGLADPRLSKCGIQCVFRKMKEMYFYVWIAVSKVDLFWPLLMSLSPSFLCGNMSEFLSSEIIYTK